MPTHNQDAAALATPAVTTAEQARAKTASAYSPDLSGHLPPLDGIRGLAILLVLLCHYVTVFWKPEFQAAVGMSEPVKVLYHLLSCGWIGVDLFFVLSGFLITGILYDARATPHYFKNFYMRRILRIFPLYYGVLLVIFLIVPIVQHAMGKHSAVQDQLYWWLFAANIAIAYSGQFQGSIGIYWSLAVEEHFYFVWPAVVRFLSRRAIMQLCAGLIVGALALRIFLTARGYSFTYICVMTPTRIDALALGSLLALAARGPAGIRPLIIPAWITFTLTLPAVLIILLGTPMFYDQTPIAMQTIGFTLQAFCFGSILILSIGRPPGSLFARFFSSPFMTFLGKYSFGIYMLHFMFVGPLSSMFKPKHMGRWVGYLPVQLLLPLLGLIVSSAVAVASYHLYEKHFLGLKRFFPYARTVSPRRP